MLTRRTAILSTIATGAIAAFPARALQQKSHLVEMYASDPTDAGRSMFFTPRILRVAAGHTVTFASKNGAHNCQSTPGMIPEGAESWRGKIGEPVSVTFLEPGYYGYHCMPHRSMGMVGLVIVEGPGREHNLSAAKAVRQPGKAKAVWDRIWTEAAR